MNAPDPTRALLAALPSGHALDALQLRTVFAGMAVGLLVLDGTGRVIDTNPAAEALLGLTREDILSRPAADPRWQAVDADGVPLTPGRMPALQALRTGQPVHNFEMGMALFGSDRRWLLVNCIPMVMGGTQRGVVCTFVDISHRRRLEQNLRQQGRRLRAVLEGTRTATWQWNVQTGSVELDSRFAEMLDADTARAAAFTFADWRHLVHADDSAGLQTQIQQHFDGSADTFEAEYRMRHRDGGWRWVRDRGRVVSRTPRGEPLAMLGTHDDITALKEAELASARHDDLMLALFELSPLGLKLVNLTESRVVAVNNALVQITGHSREALMQGDGRAHWAGAASPSNDLVFADDPAQDRFGPIEVSYLHQSGRRLQLVCNGVRVTDARQNRFLWLSVADVTERHNLEQALRAAAQQDKLTGLLNRSAMHDALQQQIDQRRAAPGCGLAVLFLDFDRFKIVNDTLGHSAGDELLRAIAQRLRSVALQRAGDDPDRAWAVARFGGDEFVIVLPFTSTAASTCTSASAGPCAELARVEAEAVLRALAEPYTVRQQALHASASIGIALWHDGIDAADDMLRDADIAMYEAKHAGRGRAVLFDDTMRARLTRAALIETELRHAVERGQLDAVYQPIIDLETGAMTSVEALMRWQHPELGAVSPAEFIPVAEESGHIMVLGEWILRTACLQWKAWQHEDPARAPALMSVNLSREQVALGRRVITLVSEALAAAHMPPGALQLEITERDVMKSPEQARALLQELSTMGVKLAMDDFGTGTSSLGCLRDYPFDTIKIDKSFVTNVCRDPHVLAVAHATVNVIENLGMVSVAEGIEDPAELAVLQSMGCRYGQGYLFARPLPADALLAAMATGNLTD
jgi:diguanylate cyclase (GGDEF)-like protein/PAS domain S-box-containing protein